MNRSYFKKQSSIVIKKNNPRIIFYYDDRTDLNMMTKFSNILKQLDIPTRKWHNNKKWIYDKVLISVSFKENKGIKFDIRGSEENFPRPYYASMGTHEIFKDDVDRTRCYEIAQEDISIFAKFFKNTPYIENVVFYRVWFHEFPSSICSLSHLRNIEFYSCRIDKFSDNFKNLSNLENIYMEFSWAQMPNSFANCKKLRKIEFREACLIDKFPEDIGNCLNLQELIYRESLSYEDYQALPVQIRAKRCITSLPKSIGDIPNLTKIILKNCVNLSSLPKELALFPWKKIRLDNSAHFIEIDTLLPPPLKDYVLIEWDYGENFYFYNINKRKIPNFEQLIDLISPLYEILHIKALLGLIKTFPNRTLQIMRILEQWSDNLSVQKNKKKFQDLIDRMSPKVDTPQGNKLYL